jgi:hypothetical protein
MMAMVIATIARAQGTVKVYNASSLYYVSTNNGVATGRISTGSDSYQFVLLIDPTAPTSGNPLTGGWTVAQSGGVDLLATNYLVAGSFEGLGGPQGVAVDGWTPGAFYYVELVGWSTTLGTDWAEITNQLRNGWTAIGYYGVSGEGYVQSGDFGDPPSPAANLFGGTGIPAGFILNAVSEPVYPPTITGQPQNQTVASGTNVNFSVGVSGTPPFQYQWWVVPGMASDAAAVPVVDYGFVVSATVTSGGAGYQAVPAVQFVGGSGSGAAGTAVVSNGVVTGIIVSNPGSGYTTPPAVEISPPTADATAVPVIDYGFVVSATITSGGAGYQEVPNVRFVGGSGSGAVGTAVVSNGVVTGITVTDAGSGYTTPPTIQIDAPTAIALPGQTNSDFSLTEVTSANAGDYFVVVSNDWGSATSSVATLAVTNADPQNLTLTATGGALLLEFTGTPNAPYVLETATNLTPPVNWQLVVTNNADGLGNWTYLVPKTSAVPTLYLRAAALSAGIVSIHSQNIVGYVTQVYPSGAYVQVAAPLQTTATNSGFMIYTPTLQTNSAEDIFGSLQTGDTILAWDGSASFEYYTYFGPGQWLWPDGLAWPPWPWAGPNFPVGTAVFYQSNNGDETNTFVGTVVLTNTVTLASGAYSLVGSTPPIATSSLEDTNLNLPLQTGDAVLLWNGISYQTYTYFSPGEWLYPDNVNIGVSPGLSVGEGFFYQSANGNETWTQNLIVQ